MKKDNVVYLEHILICIERIRKYISGCDFESFKNNEMQQDAVIRLIGIIGEASVKISPDLKEKYKEIPWADIKGMRNRIIHDYFQIRLKVVWNTLNNELPLLEFNIKKIINEIKTQTTLGFND